MFVDIIKEFIL